MANEFKVRKGLVVNGSGSVLFDVQGSQGQLFSITDSLSGSLFSVKDISGIPVMEAFSDDVIKLGTFNREGLIVSGSSVRIGNSSANVHSITGSVGLTGNISLGGNISAGATITLNGFYNSAANVFQISAGGSDSFIDSYGSVNRMILRNNSGMTFTGYSSGTQYMHAGSSGVIIGGTTPSPAARLDVRGNTFLSGSVGIGISSPTATLDVRGNTFLSGSVTGSDMLIRGSGNTSATNALVVQNSDGNTMLSLSNNAANNILDIIGSNYSIFQANQTTANRSVSFGTYLTQAEFSAGSAIVHYGFLNNGGYQLVKIFTSPLPTAGGTILEVPAAGQTFAPTSGTAAFTTIASRPTINQTGGANGTTRGLYVNPTLTAAADFRAIEWSNNAATAPSASWGLYGEGSAPNYMAGSLGIGTTSLTGYSLRVSKTITGSVESIGIQQAGAVSNDVTTVAVGIENALVLQTGATCNSYNHFRARRQVYLATSFGTQIGFLANNTLTDATNNYGFYGDIPSGTGRWNLYMNGTAQNYLAGNLGIGVTSIAAKLHVRGQSSGSLANSLRIDNLAGSASIVIRDDNNILFTGATTTSGTWIDPNGTLNIFRSINGATYGLRVYNGAGWSGHSGILAIGYQYAVYGSQGANGSEIASPLTAGAGILGRGGVGIYGLGVTPAGDSGSIGVMGTTLFINSAGNTAAYNRNASAHILSTNQIALEIDSSTKSDILYVSSSGNIGIGTGTPAFALDISGSFRTFGNITATSGSSYFIVSQSISQPAQTGSQVTNVNITPTLRYTAPNQTQTALKVAATFSGSSALSSSQTNIIADFGATSVGSQLTITDATSGSIYMVNDVSGIPIIEANSNWDVTIYDYPTKVLQKTGSAIIISGSLTIASGSSNDLYMYGHKMFNIGQFQNNSTLSGSANVSQSFQYDTTDFSEGVSLVSGSRMTVANAGYYNIQFSAQLQNIVNATSNVWIWFKKNGTNIPESATRIVLIKDEYLVAAWNFIYPANANDYFEIAWQGDSADVRILYEPASGNIPIIPSIVTSITQVR